MSRLLKIVLMAAVCGGVAWLSPVRAQTGPTASNPADDEVTRILLDRPDVPLTTARGAKPPKPLGPELPPDGSQIMNRRCRLVHDAASDWFVIKLDATEKEPADQRWVLPSEYLQAMEDFVKAQPDVAFVISGETTVYGSRPFILLRKVIAQLPTSKPASAPAELVDVATSQPAQTNASTSKPADQAQGKPADASDPESIIKRLLQDRPVIKPVLLPVEVATPTTGTGSVVSTVQKELSPGPNGLVVDRLVRAVPSKVTGWWMARFEADNTLQEPPLYLLPCELLKKSESLMQDSSRQKTRLRVTGEVTQYKGAKYLLLRKVLKEREMDQF